jgi:hypothetical protein
MSINDNGTLEASRAFSTIAHESQLINLEWIWQGIREPAGSSVLGSLFRTQPGYNAETAQRHQPAMLLPTTAP